MNLLLSYAITQIRNGYMAKKYSIIVKKYNKMILSVLKILEKHGIIKNFSLSEKKKSKFYNNKKQKSKNTKKSIIKKCTKKGQKNV